MIHPNEIKSEIRGKRLLIIHQESNTLIAEISKDRTYLLSAEFQNSLTDKSLEKIKHIATYFDGVIYENEIEENNVNEEFSEFEQKSKFERLMFTRPQINVNDICELYLHNNIDEKRKNNKFRITTILTDNTINVVDTSDHKLFQNIPIENIILSKEYQEKWYYVQNGYVGNAMMWWALDSKGYTIDITKAHKFTYDEAISILKSNEKDKRRNEKVWSCDFIDNSEKAKKLIIDMQYLEDIDNSENQLKLK
jgi:nitrogen fixation-related uncharacterized protein